MQAPYLTCHNLTAAYDSEVLFRNLSFTVHPGERWGIVGPNGAGKSTLFKLIKGTLTPRDGSISVRNNLRTAFIDQKIDFDDNATVEEILHEHLPLEYNTDLQLSALEEEINAHTDLVETNPNLLDDDKWMAKLTKLNLKMAEIQHTPTDNIIQSALKLGFLTDLADRKFQELSGGQQKRVQIIASLLKNPNLILLDEPTNHLDIQTVEWLEEFLLKIAEEGFTAFGLQSNQEESEPVAFIIISHDRALLDTLVNQVFEIEHGTAKKYAGNYEDYSEQKVQYLITEEKVRTKMANTMRRELEWLRDGVRARTTKQTARIKRAHNLDKRLQIKNQKAALNRPSELTFNAVMMDEQRDKDDSMVMRQMNLGQQELIQCKHVSIVHPASQTNDRFLFKDLNLIIKPGTRLALLGPNGCGKSTLLKYIAERIPPFSGAIKYHDLCTMSYFDQKRNTLNYNETVKNNITSSGDQVYFAGKYIHIMGYLDRFLFAKGDVNRLVSELSGGEQARLLLAQLMLEQGNVLILDEPTNDLDIPTLQVLERNLVDFDGGVIFTSHDRYFMQKVATSLLTFLGETNKISNWMFFSDLNQALDHLEKFEDANKQKNKAEIKKAQDQKRALNKPIQNDTAKTHTNTADKPVFKNPKEIAQLEKRIEEIEEQLLVLTSELEEFYATQPKSSQIQQLIQKIEDLNTELKATYQKLEKLI